MYEAILADKTKNAWVLNTTLDPIPAFVCIHTTRMKYKLENNFVPLSTKKIS